MLYLDNKLTGTRKCIGHNGSDDQTKSAFSWAAQSEMGIDDWLLGCTYRENSIEPLMRIYGHDAPEIVPERYHTMLEYLNVDETSSTMKLLGPSYSKRTQETLVSEAQWLRKVSKDPYLKFYKETQSFLYSLQPAEINPTRWMSIEKMGINLFTTPYSSNDGRVMIPAPRYVRDKSSTGRLSVVDGIRTTTMKTEHRNVLKDAWQLDFQAMEPRFLLSLIGKEVTGDFYDWVAKEANLTHMSRSKVKLAVLSSMYGHHNQIKEVTELLGLKVLEKALEKDVKKGWLRNWFGRPIHVEDKQGRHLVALWLQSSAAEAAILGFMEFCKNNPWVQPHWLIHDALVYSVDPQNTDGINANGSIIIEWNEQRIAMPYEIGRIE